MMFGNAAGCWALVRDAADTPAATPPTPFRKSRRELEFSLCMDSAFPWAPTCCDRAPRPAIPPRPGPPPPSPPRPSDRIADRALKDSRWEACGQGRGRIACEGDDRRDHRRQVPRRPPARPGRHGRRLRGRAHRHRRARRGQGDLRRRPRPSTSVVRRFQREARAAGAIETRAHRAGVRHGRGPRHGRAVHGDGAPRRRGPPAAHRAARARSRPSSRSASSAQACLGLAQGARGRRRPPRHQAGEPVPRAARGRRESSSRSSTSASPRSSSTSRAPTTPG